MSRLFGGMFGIVDWLCISVIVAVRNNSNNVGKEERVREGGVGPGLGSNRLPPGMVAATKNSTDPLVLCTCSPEP